VSAAALAVATASSSGLTGWVGWRLRALMAFAFAACIAVFLLMRWLAELPQLPLRLEPLGQQVRVMARLPGAAAVPVTALRGSDAASLMPSAGALTLPRWQVDDGQRQAQLQWQQQLRHALASAPLHATLADGRELSLAAEPRGYAGLGAWFWPLAALALLMVLLGAVVVLAQPHPGNALFALVAWAQAAALMQQAALSMPGLLIHPRLLALDLPLRGALDLLAAAAVLHALAVYPRRLLAWRRIVSAGWVLALAGLAALPLVGARWWWLQGCVLLLGVAAGWVAWRARPSSADAVQRLTRWLLGIAVAGAVVLSALAVAAAWLGGFWHAVLGASVPAWHLLVALLLLTPLVLRSRQLMREFALLASISAVAASLDLLFVALFSLSAFASLALVMFVALGLYAGLRQWLFERLSGGAVLTAERVFGQLYRAARAVQAEPERLSEQLAIVLRDLFEPIEVLQSSRPVGSARIAGAGGTLLVPVPSLTDVSSLATLPPGVIPRTTPGLPASRRVATLVLRHARKGQRIFTREDCRLADRIVDQLRRAVAYDMAVERGRGEERLRIAQDLHDDIGARLLTLMYQAPNRAMEDYLRDTLKDLKTLTRGLAAGEQSLSLAAAEWRADIEQRCTAARIELDWAVQIDRDVMLGVVAWSGLTRVLRELISNTLHHAHATRLAVRVRLLEGVFSLRVSDDGDGDAPEQWSLGLGLGGVRKRVKLLGGTAQWRQASPRGITCEVRVPSLGGAAPG
jgi:signal transduction histidine kinase